MGEIDMIKKNVKYVDFNGNENQETLYFNLTKAELTLMEVENEGLLSEHIKGAVESGDNKALIRVFKKVLLASYGIKSEDGKRFVKSDQLREEFEQSAAYSEIFMSIATNATEAEAFINGLLPQ